MTCVRMTCARTPSTNSYPTAPPLPKALPTLRRMPTSSSPCFPTRPRWKRSCTARRASWQSPPRGRLIVDMSTISPVAVRRIHADLKCSGCGLPRCAGLRRPGWREERLTVDHGRRRCGRLRARRALLPRHGHHDHACGRGGRRPDRQAVQPARLRHQPPGHLRGAGARPRVGRRSRAASQCASRRFGRLLDARQARPCDDRRRSLRRVFAST